MGFRVNNKQCSSCIFGANTPLLKGRFAQLRKEWLQNDTFQECHHSTYQGTKVCCRGYYDAVQNGTIPPAQLLRIAKRLNVVGFVDVPDTFQEKEGD